MPRPIKLVKHTAVSTLAAIALTIGALYFAQEVLIPLALAVLLCFLLAPLTKRVERLHFGRVSSVLIVTILGFGFIGTIGWIVGRQVYSLGEALPKYQGEIKRKVSAVRGFVEPKLHKMEALDPVGSAAIPTTGPATRPDDAAAATTRAAPSLVDKASDKIDQAVDRQTTGAPRDTLGSEANPVIAKLVSAGESPLRILGNYIGMAISPLGTAGIVVVFVIFMLLEREDLRDRAISLISRGQYTVTTKALDDAASRISRYLLAQSIVNGSYGITIAAGLWVIGKFFGGGVPFPSFVLWGLLCALLRFVPYVGPFIGSAFPIALALAVYPGFTVAVMTVGMFLLIELFSNNVMEPWLYGASTGLSTLAILVAAVFWTWLWGPVGLLLSTPLTVCIVVLGKYVPQLHFLDVMLGDEPALPPAVSYYQRVLAGDRREAWSIVEAYAKAHGAEHVADGILIPALRLARQDRGYTHLSSEDENAFYETTVGVIAEWEKQLNSGGGKSPAASSAASSLSAASSSAGSSSAGLPTSEALVFGCSSHHRAEELTVQMLAALLKPVGVRMEVISTRTLPVEIEQMIRERRPAAVFIAILPPGGLVQSRYLCRRLRRRFTDQKLVVGYWGRARNFDRLLVRLRSAGASYVTTSLVQSRGQIAGLLPKVGIAPAPATTPATETT